ncbi:cytosine/uracil/thiamine/allantoin permease [Desulfosporosinus orientis DSM 765]|uniref:Cytosine/uracil/thiamine/allantoin permease n=1 Tax=Desulfosporosinus orientis (strain ATCC 19365 / DSM 765 / NCIMB 8382 / VKM B-1628 / Singapore I) TaxID=768706 RepID=G7WFD0_DESOD|nr:cytosine permease [Desulfosporosinus orientis]AET68016.1 cytosine/uracil/thiamine/allantoin permease [Desulfosporosinus orientis DSM 765]
MSMNSNYIQQETVMGVVPMLKGDRQYSFMDLFLTTSGFGIATWCYTQGAYVAQFLGFKQMLINIFCFNIIWILIACLPVLFAVRYGIDLWIWLRSVLGGKGVAVLATVISLANFGWYAVCANLFATSMINLAGTFGLILNEAIWEPVLGTLCVVLGTLIALGGPNVIRWTNRFLVTALLCAGAIIVMLCFTSVPLADIAAVKPVLGSGTSPLQNFMLSAEGNVAFAFSWSTQALVMPRLAKTERSGYWATALSYGVVAPFFVAAGGVMALAMFVHTGVYESDPTKILATLGGFGFSLISLLLVAFANVGTQGTGSYVNCMIVKSGLPKISYRLLVIIAFIYVSLLTIWGGVAEHFGAFISLAAYIQGPIIGMIVVDYLIVRKRKLSLKSAYFIKGHDAYNYSNGINLVGIACVIITFAVAILFIYNPFNGSIKSTIFLLTTGSGFTAIFGGLLYWIASLTSFKKYMLRDRDDLGIV